MSGNKVTSHVAQNIAEKYQKYWKYFIAIEILPQNFRQILQKFYRHIKILSELCLTKNI